MSSLIHYTNCPLCKSAQIRQQLNVQDHSVSADFFQIWECGNCQLRFTQDVPDGASIGPYYKSEDYISHTNTSKGLVNRLYQLVRKRTLKKKRRLVSKFTGIPQGSLLDLGSGTGAFVHEMTRHGWKVTGLEPDPDARAVALESFGVTLEDMTRFFQLAPGSFDAISLWHVLEHVHELHDYMKQFRNLLRPSGRLFIAVPNYESGDANTYQENWAAYDVPRHLYHFSPRSMKILAELHGLKLISEKPMWYDSFYISMLSSRYRHGKTRYAGAVYQGLISNCKAIGNREKCSSLIYILGK